MSVTIIEGPDKCGKSTYAKQLAQDTNSEFLYLPADWIRPLHFSHMGDPFLLFADTNTFWNKSKVETRDIVLDRDILSMLAYQSFLTGAMNPIIALNLYKSVVYEHNRPDKIIYLTNEPFEAYDASDKFEVHGYDMIRDCYEKAIKLFELNFPDIPVERLELEKWSS